MVIRPPRVTDLGVLYPALLFLLPNSLGIPGIPAAPETLLLVLTFPVFWLASETRSIFGTSGDKIGQRASLVLIAVGLLFWAARGNSADLVRIGVWALTFFFAVNFSQDIDRLALLWKTWFGVALIAAVVLLISPSIWGEKEVNIFAWQHRTTYAYFISVPVVVFLVQIIGQPRPRHIWKAIFLLVLCPALALSQSRGAWLLVAIGVCALLFVVGQRGRALIYSIFVAGVGAAILWTSSNSSIELQLRSIIDWDIRSSSLYRLDIYLAGISAIGESGLWGAGPSSAGRVLGRYTTQEYQHLGEEGFATDSDLVWLAVEVGLISAAAFLLLSFSFLRRVTLLRTRLLDSTQHVFLASLVLTFLALTTLDNILTAPFGWFLLGSIWGAFRAVSTNPTSSISRIL